MTGTKLRNTREPHEMLCWNATKNQHIEHRTAVMAAVF